jgi:hypothetical protein
MTETLNAITFERLLCLHSPLHRATKASEQIQYAKLDFLVTSAGEVSRVHPSHIVKVYRLHISEFCFRLLLSFERLDKA